VIIALTIMVLVMVNLTALFGEDLTSLGSSQNELLGATILAKTMAEVRALPFQIVANGLSSTDTTLSTDSNIQITGSAPNQTYTYIPTGETIPVGSLSYTQAPFVPHITTTTVNNIPITVSAYPTEYNNTLGIYRVTVIVTWPAHLGQIAGKLTDATIVFSTSQGCQSQTNSPYSGPCQPYFFAGADSGMGAIQISPLAAANGNPIENLPFDTMAMDTATTSSEIEIEQTATEDGWAEATGGELDATSTAISQTKVTSAASDDPSSSAGLNQTTALTQGATTVSDTTTSGPSESITESPGPSDTGTTVSTSNAAASQYCQVEGGAAQGTGLPCSSGAATQTGLSQTFRASLTATGGSLGTTQIAGLSPPAAGLNDQSFAARYSGAGGTYCTTTSGDGCVHAAAQEGASNLVLAGIPSVMQGTGLGGDGSGPAGWATGNYLVSLSNYSAQVSSESGINAANPTVTVPVSGKPTPTISYWNGAGYSSMNVAATSVSQTIPIPTVTFTDNKGAFASNPVTVTITPTLSTGTATTATSTPSGCQTACTASAQMTSPIQGDITYQISQGATLIMAVDINVNLGTLLARSSYQAAV